jgi:hypothetical protein
VSEEGAVFATFTVTVIAGYEPPTGSPSERVQVKLARAQFQPEPEIPVAVNPAGNTSSTETVPPEAPVPEFETVSEYVSPVSPWANVPECDFATDNAGTKVTWLIVVGSLAESLLVTTSPPPETAAEFVTELGAESDTSTVTVIAG